MDLSHPGEDLLGVSEARILRRLAILPTGATGRRIHELSGATSLSTTQRILDRLQVIGLLHVNVVGRAHVYTLNRDHILWQPLAQILGSSSDIEDEISEIVRRSAPVGAVGAIYGSFARREAGGSSDIDIVLVWPQDSEVETRDRLIEELSDFVELRTGNAAQIISITESDLGRLVSADDPLTQSWLDDARTITDGSTLQAVLRNARSV